MKAEYQKFLRYTPDVERAIHEKHPLVALESTIISHGMPYPDNLQTAHNLQQIIRDQGAVPATVGIVEGKICLGLSDQNLEHFARAKNIEKISRRDLPGVIAREGFGATTVAGTMFCAALAGIRVFVTGGIGGVHREAALSFDVSADLSELGTTSVAVVCAGAKAILDIPKTLEVLETLGVPVIGYRTHDFPAFYTRSSGQKVEVRMDSAAEIAELLQTKWSLGLRGGVVVANPIKDEDEMDPTFITEIIDAALTEAKHQGIEGKSITPFLLDRINTLTQGKSLKANVALVEHNACLGAELARTLNGFVFPS